MKSHLFIAVAFVIFLHLFFSCAQTGNITGGVKDSIPPVLLESKPANYTVNFQEQKIVMQFDEYFELKDIENKFLTSPPLPEEPDISVKGKKLVVKLNNQLTPETTYSLDFNDAIRDFNEGNPYPAFQYVFSTGDDLDSLRISGRLVSAFDLKPIENTLVMLYENFTDSTPYLELPSFLAKTNENGDFSVRNIRAGSYHIFALSDVNKSLTYDLPNEAIAYRPGVLVPQVRTEDRKDTLTLKKIELNPETYEYDTLRVDTIISYQVDIYTPDSIELFLFEENIQNQYLTGSSRPQAFQCIFELNSPADSTLRIRPLDYPQGRNWSVAETTAQNDTLTYWITDPELYQKDSLQFSMTYLKRDSVGNYVSTTDTLVLGYYDENLEEDDYVPPIDFKVSNVNIKNNILDRNRELQIETERPVRKINKDAIFAYQLHDTIYTQLSREKRGLPAFINKEAKGLREAYRTNKNQLLFIFDGRVPETPEFFSINFQANNWGRADWNTGRDTMRYSITQADVADKDTLEFMINYQQSGGLGRAQLYSDTLKLAQKQSLLEVFGQKIDFEIEQAENNPRKFTLRPDTTTTIQHVFGFAVYPDAMEGHYGLLVDTIAFEYSYKAMETYSSIKLTILNAPEPAFIQLLNKSEEVVRQLPLKGSKDEVLFELLKPDDYHTKIVIDKNQNNKWDTGDYLKNRQPEQVVFFDKKLTTKAGWEYIEAWDLNAPFTQNNQNNRDQKSKK